MKDTITRTDGNGRKYTVDLPKINIIARHDINRVCLEHIEEDTGLAFKKNHHHIYTAQPIEHWQINTLLLTYNFKTKYYNNASNKNELYLKFCNGAGWDVDHICLDCVKENHIHTNGLEEGYRLSC